MLDAEIAGFFFEIFIDSFSWFSVQLSEVQDYWNPNEQQDRTAWRLTASEVRTILALRVDFKMEDIKRLKF